MRLLIFFIFYVFLITAIAACGKSSDSNVVAPEEPNIHEEASEYPTVTPFGIITYQEIGTIEGTCDEHHSKD